MEQLEARRVLAAALLHNPATPANVNDDSVVSPLDALLVINELNNPALTGDNGQILPPTPGQTSEQPAGHFLDTSCDGLVSPIDALLVINALNAGSEDAVRPMSSGGIYASAACAPQLLDGEQLTSEHTSDLIAPFANPHLRVVFDVPPEFGSQDLTETAIRDAFEIEVTDQQGQPVAAPFNAAASAALNLTAGLAPAADASLEIEVDGQTVSVTMPLAVEQAGQAVQVHARLINHDGLAGDGFAFRGAEFVQRELVRVTIPELNPAGPRMEFETGDMEDLTDQVVANYGRTFASRDGEHIVSEISVTNIGTTPYQGRLLVALGDYPEDAVEVVSPDGFLPDGRPFFDLTEELEGKPLPAGQTTLTRTVRFRNLLNESFQYSLSTFGNTVDVNGAFSSTPASEVLQGDTFVYSPTVESEDLQLSFEAVSAPAGFSFDDASGEFRWDTSQADLGDYSIILRAEDESGEFSEQSFVLRVATEATAGPVSSGFHSAGATGDLAGGFAFGYGHGKGKGHGNGGDDGNTTPPNLIDTLYFSLNVPGFVKNSDKSWLWLDDSDIAQLSLFDDGSWSHEKYFDGSDVDLWTGGEDLDAMALLDDGSLLVSTRGIGWIHGYGWVKPEDIMRFTPTSLGEHTAGTWELYVDGSDLGLSSWENIDGLSLMPDGRLAISTFRSAKVPGIHGWIRDEDVIALSLSQTGHATVGSWEFLVDGSDLGLSRPWEDTNALSIDQDGTTFHMSTEGGFHIPELWGGGNDVFSIDVLKFGPETLGDTLTPITLRGWHNGIFKSIDALHYETQDGDEPKPPAIDSFDPQSINEGNLFEYSFTATDPDTPASELTWTLDSGPDGSTLDPLTGEFSWLTSEEDGPGEFEAVVTVSDGALTDTETMTITVRELNQPPVIPGIDPQEVDEDKVLTLQVSATDDDLPAQELTFSLGDGAPSNATITESGLLTYTPTELDGPSTVEIPVVVTDSLQATASATVTVNVLEVNQSPVLSAIDDQTLQEGATLQLSASATDPDLPANELTYSLSAAPADATIDSVTGEINWLASSVGTFTFAVTVTDGDDLPYTDPLSDTTSFEVTVEPRAAELREGSDFVSELSETLTVPTDTSALRIQFETPEFDTTSKNDLRDAFEIEVTDAAGNRVVFPFEAGADASYNWSENLSPVFGAGVQTTTGNAGQLSTATINLAGLAAGTEIQLHLRLVNNDSDDLTVVRRIEYSFVDAAGPAPSSVAFEDDAFQPEAVEFGRLQDVTSSMVVAYGRTTLSGENNRLLSDVRLLNRGSQALRGPLLLVLRNFTELEANAIRPDGFTPAGEPYFQVGTLNPTLASGETSLPRSIGLLNDSGVRFDYQVQVLAVTNSAPNAFTSVPPTEVEAGNSYGYVAGAADPDGDAVVYSIQIGPDAATIDPVTGQLTWLTDADDVGAHRVTLRATDPYGLFVEQTFDIEVLESLPNRPPIFISDPVTDAVASSGFEVTTVGVGNAPAGIAVVGGVFGPRLVTANSGDQVIGVYAGENNDRFDDATSYSTGFRPAEGQLFDVGYSVDIGLPEFIGTGDQNRVFGLDQADLNGDGILDFVSMQYIDAPTTGERYQIRMSSMLGDGIGGFSDPTEIYRFSIGTGDFDYWNLTLEDLDNDGNQDVIALNRNRDRRLITLLGNGDGTFAPAIEQTDQDLISDFIIADINEDGVADLIGRTAVTGFGATYTLAWFEGLGDGTFSTPNEIAPGGSLGNGSFRVPQRPYDVADVNQDGHLDLIVMGTLDTTKDLQIFAGDGTGNFNLLTELDVPLNTSNVYMMLAGDFTGDSLPDIVFHDASNFHLLAADDATGTNYTYTEDTVDVRGRSYNMAGSNDPVDIDGDGDLDFIFGEYSNQASVKVARNDGSGLFEVTEYAQVDFSGEIRPYDDQTFAGGGLFGDYNRDGVMDLAYFSASTDFSGVGIRLGTRPGEFGSTRTIPWVQNTRSEVALPGDFNGDGIIDLLDTINDRTFLGNGDGTFADPFPTVGVNGGANAGGTADFNLDGLTDFVAQGGLGYKVGLSNGDGTFTLSDNSSILGSFYSISNLSVHDFNKDGYADFMSKAGVERHIDVHLNDPLNPGTFDVSFRYTLPRGSQGTNVSHWESAVDVGDYTGDGILDLIFAERDEDGDNVVKVIVMAGDGAGDFTLHSELAGFGEDEQSGILGSRVDPGDFSTGDIDEDGDLDLLSATYRGMRVFLNDGTGNFTFTELLDHVGNNQRERETWLVDFDEDGHLDIFQTGQQGAGPILVWQGDGTGKFEVTQSVGAIASVPSIYDPFVDVDGDGHLDFVYATAGFGNYNSEEAAIFAGRRDDLVDIVSVDLNGDGNNEVLAIQDQMERLQIFVGDSLGGLTRQPDLQTGRAPKAVTAADLDNDGQVELLTVNRASRDISLFSGDLTNGFASISIPAGIGPVDIAAADLDGDGNEDVVVLDDFDNALLVYPGNGTTALAAPVATALGDRPSRFVLEDATGDGTLDAVVTLPDSSRLMVLPGNGTGAFDSPFYINLDSSPTDVAVLDLNDDGNPDLAATIAATGVLSIHYGLGGNQFARAQEVRVGDSPNRVAVADADEDGRLDLIVSNAGDDTVSVVYNRFDPNEVYRYDSDAIDPDNDPLTYSIVDGPGGLIINSQSGALLWAASPDQVGVHDVTIAADDGRGGVATQAFKIEVEPARENSAPVIATKPLEQIGANEVFTYSANALDNDNHPLRYTLLDGPEGASIDATTGELIWDGRTQAEAFGIGGQGGDIRVPIDASLKPESITVEGWFEMSELTRFNEFIREQGILVTTHERDQSFRVDVALPGENLRFFVPITPQANKWYHLAFTYDAASGEARLYVDGELGGSDTASEPRTLNTTPGITTIGRGAGGTRGKIDEYRIWNYARSEAEVREGMSRQYEGDSRLLLDFRFEDGKNTTSVRDYSIYGNEGYRVANGTQTQQRPGLTETGNYEFTVLVEDGRGGSDTQSFALTVVPELRGSISGTLFEDLNSDGDQDDGSESPAEPGLADWQLFIDSNGNAFADPGELQTTTDANGNYSFEGLLPGLYPIRVAPTAGFTTPVAFNAEPQLATPAELDPSSVTEYDVAVEQLALGQIQGSLATEDADPIAYWNAYADLNDTAQHDVGEPITSSDRNGDYALSGLPAGDYIIRTENPAGWTDVAGNDGLRVTLSQDEVSENNDFTLAPTNTSVASGLLFVTSPQTAVEARQTFTYASVATGITNASLVYDLSLAPEGMVIDPATGLVAWRPTIAQVGQHTVILRVRDAVGSVALQEFSLDVSAPNTSPLITGPKSLDAYVGSNYVHDLFAQDAEDTELTFALTEAPAAASIDPDSGRLNWLPTLADVGQVAFTATITDSAGAMGSVSWTVQVQDVNVPELPLVVREPRGTAAVGISYFSRVVAEDAMGRPVTWSLSSAPAGLALEADGLIQWTPVAADLGPQVIDLVATTADGTTEVVSITIDVLGRFQNVAPEINSVPTVSVSLGQVFAYDLDATDADGDVLAYTLLEGPIGMSIHPALGMLRWIPNEDQRGEHRILVQVSDPSGAVAEQEFELRVSRFGGPPTLTSTPPVIANVGTGYLYSVTANDREGDPLTYTLLDAPTGMSIVATTGEIAWTPTLDQIGSQDVVVQVSDGIGGAVTQAFTVEVFSGTPNLPPTINSQAPRFASVGSVYSYSLAATDPESTAIAYSLGQGPAGMVVDSVTGEVAWTPTSGQVGKQIVTLIATDEGGASAIESFEVDVLAANNAPSILSVAPTSSVAGTEFLYDVLVEDVDLDPLSYELVTGPAGATVDVFGRIRWSPANADLGPQEFEVRVTDPRGGEASQSFTLEVVADVQPPLVSLIETPDDAIQNVLPWRSPFVVYAKATDNVGIASLTLEANGQDIPLDAAGTAQFSFEDWSFAGIEATATAVDLNGNVTTQTINFSYDFPEGWSGAGSEDIPTAEISSPRDTASVTGLVSIVGTADHPDLFGYKLSYRRVDVPQFTEFFEATGSVVNGELGVWDTTLLPNDEYIIRLETATNTGVVNVVDHNVGLAGELKLGNFQLSFTDLVIPVGGIPVEITRIYDSLQADREDDFGFGWRLEYRNTDLRVGLPASGLEDIGIFPALSSGVKVYLNVPGEGRQGFTFDPDIRVLPGFGGENLVLARPRFRPDPGVTSTLSTGTSGYLQVNERGELFAPGGIPYNPASPDFGGSYGLTTQEGVSYRISGATGELLSATDLNGNSIEFGEAGIESSLGDSVEFGRDVAGRVVSITDAAGQSLLYSYDRQGRLRQFTDRNGNTSEYLYDATRPNFLQEVVDPLGNTGVRGEYDASGRIVSVRDAAGNELSISTLVAAGSQEFVDALGNTTTVRYDDLGNVISEVDALGNESSSSFDNSGNRLSETDELGRTVRFTYDGFGNILTRTDAAGGVTSYTYANPRIGQVASVTDTLGETTEFEYDSRGNIIRVRTTEGREASSTYDAAGRLLSETTLAGESRTYQYDDAGNLLQESIEGGQTTNFVYDAVGQVIQTTANRLVEGVSTVVTETFEYDGNGNVIRFVAGDGAVTQTSYDANDRVEAVIDARGFTTRYVYDVRGNLVETIHPDGTDGDLGDNPRTSATFDVLGRMTSVTDELGNTTRMNYDAIGQLVERILPDATPADLSDNPRTTNEYDAAGQLTATVNERGHRTQFTYDNNGFLASTVDAQGKVAVAEFDAEGRQTRVVNELGFATDYLYNFEGRFEGTRFADGSQSSVGYDEAGRPVSRVNQNGEELRFEYDALGRVVSATQPSGAVTEFEYDEVGNRVLERDANGNETRNEFDTEGRLVRTVLPEGQSDQYVYDLNGNLVSYTDFSGSEQTFEYDERNRLTRKSIPGEGITDIAYFANGLIQQETTPQGTTVYAYDAQNRLVTRTTPDGNFLRYAYDEAGNVVSMTSLAGETTYQYDELNRVVAVTEPSGATTNYLYDAAGRLISTTYGNGVVESREYNSVDYLTRLQTTGSAGTLLQYDYEHLPNGRRSSVTDLGGKQTAYAYDVDGRLIEEAVFAAGSATASKLTTFTYDAAGNRLTSVQDGVQTAYVYDTNNRLLSENEGGVLTTYSYDANGNQTSRSTAGATRNFIFASNNRLMAVDLNGDSAIDIEYLYDSDGNLVERTSGGETIRYQVDTTKPLADIVVDYTPTGAVVASYSYGNGLNSQSRAGQTYFYHADSLGSIRAVSDSNQVLINSYSYEAFGEVDVSTEGVENAYQFDAQRRDPETGLDYLRARHYDSSQGRLVSIDPFAGQPTRPDSVHDYVYASNDPINSSDPSGLITLLEVSFSSSSLINVQKAFATSADKGLKRAAGVADKLIAPGTNMQNLGLQIAFSNRSDRDLGYDIYLAGSEYRAAGFAALQVAIGGIYLDTLKKLATDAATGLAKLSPNFKKAKDGYDRATKQLNNVKKKLSKPPFYVESAKKKPDLIDALIARYVDESTKSLSADGLARYVNGQGGQFEKQLAKSKKVATDLKKALSFAAKV